MGYDTWFVCVSVCLSVGTYSCTMRNNATKKQYQRVQWHTGLIIKQAGFREMALFKSYGVKRSVKANMLISTASPRQVFAALHTVKASEVT